MNQLDAVQYHKHTNALPGRDHKLNRKWHMIFVHVKVKWSSNHRSRHDSYSTQVEGNKQKKDPRVMSEMLPMGFLVGY